MQWLPGEPLLVRCFILFDDYGVACCTMLSVCTAG